MPFKNPVMVQRLMRVAQDAAAAPSGGKQAIYAAACQELDMSLATLHRHLKKITVKPERKKRSDAGRVWLTRNEAVAISAVLMESHRKNKKRLMAIGQAVQLLRANDKVRAERVDAITGECVPLSDSAIARSLKQYGLHPDQLNQPTPSVQLKSLHPNHVWQIDASICVLYYLKKSVNDTGGLRVMEREAFNKNKPKNLKRIESDRVWSYEVTDHYSGAIFVHYVYGSEDSANLIESFIEAIQKRPDDPMHGVPFHLMMDMGSAMTSGMFKNLARRLQVNLIAHSPGNARATGQVEKARDLIEKSFESGLKFKPIKDLAELNAQAQCWSRWYNATQIHSRHGRSRFDQWMKITAEQLRIAPDVQMCQALVSHNPESRKVTTELTVSFKGQSYDVRDVPNVMIGESLQVSINPYAEEAALVIYADAEGNEVLHSVPLIKKDEGGFREDANVINEDYKRPKNTVLEANRDEVRRFAMQASTNEEAQAKAKANVTPFGGQLDPFKVIEQAPERTYLPKRGIALPSSTTTSQTATPVRVLSLFEIAAELVRRGMTMNRERNEQIRFWYPDGVPEDQIDALRARLEVRGNLRVVAAGGA